MGGPINRSAECSIALLRSLLIYDPETGKLYWRFRPDHMFRSSRPSKIAHMWNKTHAGKEAFTATDGDGYRCGAIFDRLYRAQRVCFAIHHGYWPDEVDHENGDRGDNRIANLKDAGSAGNMKNRAVDSRNSSGVTGVTRTANGSWLAKIGRRGSDGHRQKTVKSFPEAVALRAKWETELGYSTTHGRRNREYSSR